MGGSHEDDFAVILTNPVDIGTFCHDERWGDKKGLYSNKLGKKMKHYL